MKLRAVGAVALNFLRASIVVALYSASVASAEAEMLDTPEARLAKGLQELSEYCLKDLQRNGEPSYDGKFQLDAGAVTNIIISGEKIIVLDSSKVTCGDEYNGYCGSGGCWIAVYFPQETVDLLGDFVVVNEINRQNFLYCSVGKSYIPPSYDCYAIGEVRRFNKY